MAGRAASDDSAVASPESGALGLGRAARPHRDGHLSSTPPARAENPSVVSAGSCDESVLEDEAALSGPVVRSKPSVLGLGSERAGERSLAMRRWA